MTAPDPLRAQLAGGEQTASSAGHRAELATLARLRTQLGQQAAAESVLDVAYRTLDTPIGTLLLAATPTGLVRVAFASADHDHVLNELADRISPRILYAPARLDLAAHELDEYFGGRRRQFDLPLDLQLAHGFRAEVLRRLPMIAYGATASYTDVAVAAGSPKAVRAVGSACATNPIPLVIPCHRVLRSDGTLGGYLGGVAVKRALLELESTPALESTPPR